MLIKKIMDTIEANSTIKIYSDDFIIHKNRFKNYTDVRFYNFAINYNISLTNEEEKNKIIDLYVKSKNIINILNKFSKKIRVSLYKKYDNNRDLRFNPLDKYKENEKINIIQNKTIYKFRILDLIYLWKSALFKSENMFAMPKELKNPYTNVIFKKHNLYNIFFSFNKTTYVVPEIILSFFKCSFDIPYFKKKHYPFLQENAIEYFGKNAFYIELIEYMLTMLHFFRKDNEYIFLKNNLSHFKKKWIVNKMKPMIILYLKYKFLCNPLLKDNYCFKIKQKLKSFFKYNFSPTYFIKLTPIEQTIYERRDIFSENSNSSNIDDISLNPIDSNNLNTNVSLIDSDSEIEEEQIFPNPTPPPIPNNIFTYRRRPRHNRRRQTIFIPPIENSTTYDELLNSLSNNNINSSLITSMNISDNIESSNTLPNLVENTVITNSNPFESRREIPRTPSNQHRRNQNSIRSRFTLF
tara:strand:+ start:555 stop:1952 length:1398 start_codon:yes stop_codon:yes gene_type:complete